jgi:hypothetical protein
MTPAELERLRLRLEAAGADGLRQFAVAVLEEAKRNLPIGDPAEDPNPAVALRAVGNITPDGDGFVVSFDAPYAAKQHEDQRLSHPRGGGPKFLERALTTLAPAAQEIVGSRVHARFAGGLLSTDPNRPHR